MIPKVLWLTGFSGSGKSTVAERLKSELLKRGCAVELLDGDRLRAQNPGTGFTKHDRIEHLKRAARMASQLEKSGKFVIAALISPYRESREFARHLCKNFIEVHLSTPLEECEKRDVKGLYARARAGEIPNFTGVSDPYEPPLSPELRIDTSRVNLEETVRLILETVSAGN